VKQLRGLLPNPSRVATGPFLSRDVREPSLQGRCDA
jgi:hypothetical protein